ncbi:MAG: hypothetical protein PHO71_25355 [Bacteroides sp.]|nr:hypothetical protein [Bacteroides sp.]
MSDKVNNEKRFFCLKTRNKEKQSKLGMTPQPDSAATEPGTEGNNVLTTFGRMTV